MFKNFTNLIERMKGMSYNKTTIENAVGCEILASGELREAQRLWRSMYESSSGTHLPHAISAELARMITIELSSKISGSQRAEYLNEAYQNVISGIRVPVELGCALGGIIFKPYFEAVSGAPTKAAFANSEATGTSPTGNNSLAPGGSPTGNKNLAEVTSPTGNKSLAEVTSPTGTNRTGTSPTGSIRVDLVTPDCFLPTAVSSDGKITGAVFIQRVREGGAYLTRLGHHKLSGSIYTIRNYAYRSLSSEALGRPISLSSTAVWRGLDTELQIGNVKQPLFGYFRPAAANFIDPSSPMGVSVFSGAVSLIDDADKQYARYLWEFESGERALIANSMAFRTDRNGHLILPDKRLYRTLDVDDVDFFREWSPQLREAELSGGLDRICRQIELSCGLAYGTLSDIQSTDRTAEEIRSSKQRSYVTVTDNQKALKNALTDLVYAMDVWASLYHLTPHGGYSISFDFDDSIAADRRTEFEEKKQLVDMGIMQPWELRMWYFGETEDEAKRICNESHTEAASPTGSGSPTEAKSPTGNKNTTEAASRTGGGSRTEAASPTGSGSPTEAASRTGSGSPTGNKNTTEAASPTSGSVGKLGEVG